MEVSQDSQLSLWGRLWYGWHGLSLLRGLHGTALGARLTALLDLDPDRDDLIQMVDCCAAFQAALDRQGGDLGEALWLLLREDDNLCVRRAGDLTGLGARLGRELEVLGALSGLDGAAVWSWLPEDFPLTLDWPAARRNFARDYPAYLAELPRQGFGVFARYAMFTVRDGALVPVAYPDPQRLDRLYRYERERAPILANTQALLEGRPANNVLLYGDAGTGKSATVKAIVNEYRDRGLRLIELKKSQLHQLPEVLEQIGRNPLKFLIYIDDLSFAANDDNFSALKAVLEGSAGGHTGNFAVYATSNRRHLVKENFGDRTGDEIHLADTMQELMSLSARFGLTVTFQRPDKALYLDLVRTLARQGGVTLDDAELERRAEAHAIRCGGRSPRLAKQFAEMLAAGVA
ncbi:MAG: ATP-binding protein [Oscillospiraceae bacterium]|jgi:predicted AAA+ superfamily ATPase|nr:ATP-binding protein [Oscillospiraceae bacterium]